VPVARQHVRIGRAQRAQEHPVAHRAAVDEEILRHRRAARIGGQRSKPRQAQPLARGVDPQRILGELAPHDPGEPLREGIKEIALLGLGAEHGAPLAPLRDIAQRDRHARRGHGKALDGVGNGLRLGPLAAQELEPRGRGKEEIAQRDRGAGAARGGLHRAQLPTCHGDFRRLMALGARRDREPPHGPQ
jgi:hypothetical protein